MIFIKHDNVEIKKNSIQFINMYNLRERKTQSNHSQQSTNDGIETNDDEEKEKTISQKFINQLKNSIIESLKFKKREPLVITRVSISEKVFFYLKDNLQLNGRYNPVKDSSILKLVNFKRFFEDKSNTEMNSFKAKISQKKGEKYYELKENNLVQYRLKDQYIFSFQYRKKEKTSFMNRQISQNDD